MMEENSSENSSLNDSQPTTKCHDNSLADFRKYQIVLLVLTQLGYVSIAACLLVASVFSAPTGYCEQNRTIEQIDIDFHSLLIEWDMACITYKVRDTVASVIMFGGLAGAFLCGYLADAYGRRPTMLGCLLTISLGCLAVSLIGGLNWLFTTFLLGILGAACGGYMVVNLTLVVEFLCTSRSRLLVVSVNGWPMGMTAVAALYRYSGHWRPYFYFTTAFTTIIFVLLYWWSLESVRWLASKNRVKQAVAIAEKVIDVNGDSHGSQFLLHVASRGTSHESNEPPRHYRYTDLLRYPSIRRPLLALTYCFVASSIVSFGYYFFVDVIPGNRITNLGAMGLLKLFCGLIPFMLSFIGRRPMVLVSLGVACVSSYTILILYYAGLSTTCWLYGMLSIIAAAAIDPAWKVNHLYSTELFPTSVRSMARAVCNIGGRLGSVVAPWIAGLSSVWFLAPYLVFTAFVSVQWIVTLCCLPETRDRPLVEGIIEEETEQNKQHQYECRPVTEKLTKC
ncbi:unnamed protein product, partial [Mesorhabditis spiculigera]